MTALRIGYTCHDRFPSTDTNTQQVFWTLSEMARLGHAVDLCVPAVTGGVDAPRVIAEHYGAPGATIPATLRFVALGTDHDDRATARGRFDMAAPARFSPASHDVIWTRDPLALVSALGVGVPVVFETYRPDFAASRRFGVWRAAALKRRLLAGVITHSRLAANAFVAAGIDAERVLVAHNGHAPELMQPVLSRDEARRLTKLPADVPLVVYTGHVGRSKGTDALVGLASALPDAHIVIVGVDPTSAEAEWLEQCVARAGVRNVIVVPRVSLQDVARYLYAADALIIPPTDAPLRRFGRTVLPMKLFSYMAAGRPIVAPALPDVEEVLINGRTALLVPTADGAAGAAAAVRALLADSVLAARLGDAAQQASRTLTWSARALQISAALEQWLR